MKKLIEYEIAENYINKPVNTEKLLKTFTDNGGKHQDYKTGKEYYEYIAYCNNFDEEEWEIVRLTDALFDKWDYEGIDFRVYLHIENDKITECTISKFKYTGGYHGRPSVHVLSPTQQEIRIFRRLMDYITT